ncbi:MAG: glycosyltransferase family 39 protein [Candidatus Promineifilaceae bacterium]|nr:glycosyltransferase family 39 protein [Candidatus Promineifilaceae bacterium]
MPQRHVSLPILLLTGMMLLGLLFGSWGIRKNLPYFPETDEAIFVGRAVRMAANWDLNPGWFGHPGSTTFYPLMLLYHIWYGAAEGGSLFTANPDLQNYFQQQITSYYMLGRLLSVIYAVLSLPVTYLLGKCVFNRRVGLIAAWLLLINAVYWYYAQIVRTDTSALFWTVLSLWLCVLAYERPTWSRFAVAGFAIGLSVASRYFMVALVPFFFLLWLATLRSDALQNRSQFFSNGLLGLLAVLAGFALATPYFFLDAATAVQNLLTESRSEHLGADGFTPLGNLWWYLTTAIPRSISGWQAILALAGILLALFSRKLTRISLVAFVFIFLLGISLSPLHWMRWIAQLLPLFALFAALTIDTLFTYLGRRLGWQKRTGTAALLLLIALISIWPLYQLALFEIKQSSLSTRVMARRWMVENLPAGSKIAQENYTAPLQGTSFETTLVDSLGAAGKLESYAADGYDYLVASSGIYARYLAEPERYPVEVAFYNTLFNETHLLQQIEPSSTRAGPTVLIYQLP